MKQFKQMAILCVITFVALTVLSDNLSAQQINPPNPGGGNLPFIDRDGDGINDLLQHGWGLRFAERFKKRHELWEQLNIEIIRGEDGWMVDTDGDGIGDISFRDYMKDKMNELIDTDGDGIPDTPLKDYLGRRFKAFDRNGDGLPDDMSREEFRELMKQMRNWRQEMHDRVRQGLPPFIDADGDGIPDGFPGRFPWMRGGK